MSDNAFDADAVQDALLARADAFRSTLEAQIQDKLAGGVLHARSGALAASIQSAVEDEGSAVSIVAASSGVDYAAIQEFGGKTSAHDIIAVKAKALAFNVGAGRVFAKSVHHPGSNIPARSYIGSSLSDMQDEIAAGLKQAVLAALGRD